MHRVEGQSARRAILLCCVGVASAGFDLASSPSPTAALQRAADHVDYDALDALPLLIGAGAVGVALVCACAALFIYQKRRPKPDAGVELGAAGAARAMSSMSAASEEEPAGPIGNPIH